MDDNKLFILGIVVLVLWMIVMFIFATPFWLRHCRRWCCPNTATMYDRPTGSPVSPGAEEQAREEKKLTLHHQQNNNQTESSFPSTTLVTMATPSSPAGSAYHYYRDSDALRPMLHGKQNRPSPD